MRITTKDHTLKKLQNKPLQKETVLQNINQLLHCKRNDQQKDVKEIL